MWNHNEINEIYQSINDFYMPQNESQNEYNLLHDESQNENNLLNNVQTGSAINYKIINHKHLDGYNIDQDEFEIENLDNTPMTFIEAIDNLDLFFNDIMERFIEPLNTNDQVQLVFNHTYFRESIAIGFLKKYQFNIDLIKNAFDRVAQSFKFNQERTDQKFIATITTLKIPTGGTKKKQKPYFSSKKQQMELYASQSMSQPSTPLSELVDLINKTTHETILDKFIQSKYRSIIDPSNFMDHDHLCLIYAILIAKNIHDDSNDKKNYRTSVKLKNDVNKLISDIKIDTTKKLGIDEIKLIEIYLKHYKIVCYDWQNNKNVPIYINNEINLNNYLYILLHNDHFYTIKSMTAFTESKNFCNFCQKSFEKFGDHMCPTTCKMCKHQGCIDEKNKQIKCCFCQKICSNFTCLKYHEENTCRMRLICSKCQCINKKNRHVCDDQSHFCFNCKISVEYGHKCHILTEDQSLERDKNKQKKNDKFDGYIFFDIETYTDNNTNHHPNMIVAAKRCSTCLESNNTCINCNNYYTFYTMNSFCEWIFTHENFICIAHNLKGFDGCFVLDWILKNMLPIDSTPQIIVNGTKLLSINFRSLKFIDSLSFISTSLETFPKTFGLKEIKKGFFPHSFNKPENFDKNNNINYVGAWPAKEYYQADSFSEKKRNEFNQWYESVKHNTFNFHDEMLEYCKSDVKLLLEGCLEFRLIIMKFTKELNQNKSPIDPFRISITIASMCQYLFRRYTLKPETIANIPEHGYNMNQTTSKKCRIWLKYLSELNNIKIAHARNGGEFKIGNYMMDGFCLSNKTLYEFDGCYWHGCIKTHDNPNGCYYPSTWNSTRQETMATTNFRHNRRRSFIQKFVIDNNLKLVAIKECRFDEMAKNDPKIIKIINDNLVTDGLKPRDSLFGGRTNAFVLYFKCKPNQIIRYVDVCSLYPWVMKYGKFPIGHPNVITEKFQSIENYFGLIKCRILAPKNLYAPVLPCHINSKLVFPLCSKCAAEKLKICNHNDNERVLEGTWCSLEIEKAIEKGYKIIDMLEVWHWDKYEQYDKSTKSGGLFTDYINKALKLKLEASGYPSYVLSEDDKIDYIKRIFDNEGVQLDKNNISYNAGIRSISKLILNSLWGYLAMKQNKTSTKIINNPTDWFKMVIDSQYNIKNINIQKNHLVVEYNIDDNLYKENNKTNVALASFITAQGRLKLYDEIDKLGQRVLYFDTDSIIYYRNIDKEEYEPKLGEYLGDLTDEIDPKDGNYIVEFVSAGPKNYAYKTDKGVTKCTIKGFTLNYITSLTLDFEKIKDIVQNNQTEKVLVEQYQFKRTKTYQVTSKPIDKKYGFVYDKRILNQNLTTIPYGYISC